MTRRELIDQILAKRSFLCVGLDTDITKIPEHFKEHSDPIFEFNKEMIDATKEYCVAYKLNTAFYEAMGESGWSTLHKTAEYIPKGIFKIADAKRGDIGNTSDMYAKAFFKAMSFDAVTVAPYMGADSVLPFLAHKDKWAIILALTSNEGSKDFQMLQTGNDEQLFEKVIQKIKTWGTPENSMLVVGATHPKMLARIRAIVPDHFFLVPGVGAQGGDLSKIAENGMSKEVGLLVNASRSIIYAGSDKSNYLSKAIEAAALLQSEMEAVLKAKKLV